MAITEAQRQEDKAEAEDRQDEAVE